MSVLAVGTTNPGKVAAVKTAIGAYAHLAAFQVMPAKVASGVSDQPMTLDETTQGAKNRATAVRHAVEGASLGIGMESGLFQSDGKLFDVCACAIDDGEQCHVGYSCAWELPTEVAKKVLNEGMNLTDAFNACDICNDPNIGDKGGVLAIMSGNRVTRPDYTVQSIQMAILALNPRYYQCSAAVPEGINDEPAPVRRTE
mmetsp:Transcript_61627/g.156655  ORF Transcript_61627/g.156655 Transcript_61627/m.156655 type:complete len:199 (+) Transcript_61627:77-673(+)|eukprot:CAMPEP_0183550354 /NCGR_PEP_ID=MMETSP0371-20130417/64254_1 /TAXON_ID=268820 /ORGANISM="Peridinium aciculiferum, Strain PAER-2" /LENGTH=198 /DNA_ID=CAMNT_0025754445 /DNA_START=70 /DNA_END=666 /DNA_ORIENTATION=+